MYYSLILVSVILFGGCFALSDEYRKERGSGLLSSMESCFIGASAGFVILLALGGVDIRITPFTLLMALLSSSCGMLYTWFSFKMLDSVNLSVYSLFSMLGGMTLPFFQGILFYGEKLTVSKCICFVFVCTALGMTVAGDKRGGSKLCYLGVFVLNGMSGVLTKIFTASHFEKTTAQCYSAWIAMFTALISGTVWLCMRRNNISKCTGKAFCISATSGSLNRVANLILVIALMHVDASVQYPMVTGGVIIVSTLIGFLRKERPALKEIVAVLLAFIGMLFLL